MKTGKRKIYKYVFALVLLLVLVTTGCTDGTIGSSESSSSSKSAPIANNNNVLSPLVVDNSNVELYSGDSYRVSITGGLKPYSFEDSSGHFDSLRYLYTSPYSVSPLTEVIKVIDALGSTQNINFKIKTYEPELQARSNVMTSYHSNSNKDFLMLSDGTIIISSYTNVNSISGVSYRNILLRSLDGGNTYTVIYTSPNTNQLKLRSLSNGSFLLINEVPTAAGGKDLSIKISSNRGDSFSDLSVIPDLAFSNMFVGSVTNSLFLFGSRLNAWNVRVGVLYKSTDNGVSWNKISEFDFNNLAALCITDFVGFMEVNANSYFVSINISDYGSGAGFADQWYVQKTTDGGATWTTSDSFVLASGKAIYGDKIMKLPNGNFLTLGWAFSATSVPTVFTRLSTDGGATWNTVNTYNYASGKSSSVTSTILSSAGKVWMLVGALDSSNVSHKILRYTTDGSTWSVASDDGDTYIYGFQEDSSGNVYFDRTYYTVNSGFYYRSETEIVKITPSNVVTTSARYKYSSRAIAPSSALQDVNGNLLIGGTMSTTTYSLNSWLTQISTNNGVNWTDSDTYLYPASTKSSNLVKLIKTNSGSLLALGNAMDASSYNHLIVRKGTPNGVGSYTWATVNDSRETATSQESPIDILQSSSGRAFVAETSTYSGTMHWVVKKSSADFSTWTNVDNGIISGSVYNYAIGLLQDTQGRIYSIGYASGSAMSYGIRISDDDGLTWSTQRVWNTYTKNYLTISNGTILYNVGVKGSTLTFEKSVDRGQTWTVLGQKTVSSISVNSIKVDGDNVFVFGSFTNNGITSSTLRYNISQDQLTSLDSLLATNKTIGLAPFDCQNQSWCLLSSQVGTYIGETIATVRRMSK